MTTRYSLLLVALWNDSWFFRLNVILAIVGLIYLLLLPAQQTTPLPPPANTP